MRDRRQGNPASCTSQAVVSAVARGGTIRFDCGPRPVTIKMAATAKVRNTSGDVVIDGGGKVTLSGVGKRRILYMNTCDRAQVWTTSHCQDQATPRLTVKNIGFADGNSIGQVAEGGGGGAIFVRGGRLERLQRHLHPQPVRGERRPTWAARPSACSTSTATCPSPS